MPKLSIIMPSLNVHLYIKDCLESVIHQTLHDLEILCIDAGSTDGTWEILEKYAGKDNRIRLIRSPQKSYGYQMNLGIRESTGEYIGIVETDDFILPEMYQELYTYAKKNDAEFVKSDFNVFTTLPNGERLYLKYSLKKYSSAMYYTVFTSEDYFNDKNTVDIFAWNGIYRKSFLVKNHIQFQETPGAAFQDCGFRYQIALNVKRGFFLDRSFYCYRRDNTNSSTYNSKCVLFNLSECKNLIRIASQTGKTKKRQMEFLAREIAVIAHRPYIELLTWGQPEEGTKEALNEFRTILKNFINKGILNRMSVTENDWLAIRIFVDNPEFYDYYAHLKAEATAESVKLFLKDVISYKHIILFGSGYIGSCAYCLLRSNRIHNITAFCDNDKNKWGLTHMGLTVISPENATKQYPDALFIITNAAHSDDIQRQLCGYGIDKKQITTYSLSTSPMDCTNMIMRLSDMEKFP